MIFQCATAYTLHVQRARALITARHSTIYIYIIFLFLNLILTFNIWLLYLCMVLAKREEKKYDLIVEREHLRFMENIIFTKRQYNVLI